MFVVGGTGALCGHPCVVARNCVMLTVAGVCATQGLGDGLVCHWVAFWLVWSHHLSAFSFCSLWCSLNSWIGRCRAHHRICWLWVSNCRGGGYHTHLSGLCRVHIALVLRYSCKSCWQPSRFSSGSHEFCEGEYPFHSIRYWMVFLPDL